MVITTEIKYTAQVFLTRMLTLYFMTHSVTDNTFNSLQAILDMSP